MILSHRHRFIYIKTFKTASTSIEAALLPICGPDDIITPPWPQAQNFRIDHPLLPKRPLMKRLFSGPPKLTDPSVGYYHHMPAWRVRSYVGEDIWNSYFKFSFERNPWDRQVSQYLYWRQKKADRRPVSFEKFMEDRERAYVGNFDLYSQNDAIILDVMGRYETLASDLDEIIQRLLLENTAPLPHLNASGKRSDHYREFYDSRTEAIVADWYSREIAYFGYRF